jgi:hypothetical protein
VEPEIQRIGKYKSAGDQLARKTISEEVKEMLTALLDNTYENWLDVISSTLGTWLLTNLQNSSKMTTSGKDSLLSS